MFIRLPSTRHRGTAPRRLDIALVSADVGTPGHFPGCETCVRDDPEEIVSMKLTPALRIALAVLLAGGVVAVGPAESATAAPTDTAFGPGRPHPYGNVWSNDHVHAARLGLGNQAFQGMRTMLQKYQNYPNGMTNNTNGVFEYLGVHLTAMNESLLQSYNDKIRVFPAVPTDASFVGKFTLLAKDGFLVSSEREAGEVKYVGLRSQYGKTARVVNPWGGQEVRVRRTSDNAVLTTTSAAEISFATAANTVYVVERTAKPLSAYATGSWETFALVRNTDGSVSLRATVNNRYVVAENGGAEALVANRDAIGPWEKFDLVTL
ncbi:glycoside hydrolase family 95-like protein [Micromonospora sp. NPDC048843]|uniref:fascin domain-containing protein n=1 Tax=Micromonospora sp. NPDC048843 TaxID=3155389 RepID=UPI0034055AFC